VEKGIFTKEKFWEMGRVVERGEEEEEEQRVNVIIEHERCKKTQRWAISFYLSNLWQKDGLSRDRVGGRG
jgi:hypothetical protein